MKKLSKKLSLERQTLRNLSPRELTGVAGGILAGAWACSRSPTGCSTVVDSRCCFDESDVGCYTVVDCMLG